MRLRGGAVRPTGQTYMPALSGRECGLRGRLAHKRRGNLRFPLLLRITTLSYRARCARKDKCRFPSATRLPGQGKQNGCHPKGAGARCAPLRRGNSKRPRGVEPPLLVVFSRWAAETLPLRTLRAQRALICGSKCRKSSGRCLPACSYPKENGVIRKRGETSCLPSCVPAAHSREYAVMIWHTRRAES